MMPDVRIQMIRSARLKFGEAPRNFRRGLRSYLRVKRPLSLFGGKSSRNNAYRDFKEVVEKGRVVWGSLVMANNSLFAKGTNDAPGVVVYSPHYHLQDDLLRLATAAEKVSDLRTQNAVLKTDEERHFSTLICDDYAWFTNQSVPSSIVGENSLLASCLMFFRKHVPNQLLATNFFPLVVHPEKDTVVVLPECFWPAELRTFWQNPT